MRAIIGLLLLLTGGAALGQVAPGQIVVSYPESCACGFTFPKLAVFDGSAVQRFALSGPAGGDVLYDPAGLLHVIYAGGPRVYTYSAALRSTRTLETGLPFAVALAMDASRRLYVIDTQGEFVQFSAAGERLRSGRLPLPSTGLTSADVGTDQCTIHYLVAGSAQVHAWDLCAEVLRPGAPLPRPACSWSSVRVSPDGSLLIAGCDAAFRIAGGVTTTHDTHDFSYAAAPTDGGRSIWTAGHYLSKISLETNGIVARSPAGLFSNGPPHLAVFGQPRAAAMASVAAVPLAGEGMLVVLAVSLVAAAVMRLRL